jgi:hypothetical protein
MVKQTIQIPDDYKQFKIINELTEEFEIAQYSNLVNVVGSMNEIILTFSQIITPLAPNEVDETKAKPVARVIIPKDVAVSLIEILKDHVK